ncbi:accessory Sec system protein Asp2 [Lactobacillus sp. MRS-253-APC-2B]|uniref:accessory Sec system protein Asp2 n=1 Tax=Lactobacillus sp. MRS-253-APC-2B TaxID=2725305 RepID=UPI00146BF07A|nr:accessory Sec system protein Asp2 [Lactobacillus sp. MRS-253-APC-2B]
MHALNLNVLQLGKNNWQRAYQIPAALNWHFNDLSFLEDPKVRLQLIIISEPITLVPADWQLLQEHTDPYNVVWAPELKVKDHDLTLFLRKMAARKLTMPIQEFINHIEHYYFVGQQGISMTSAALMFDTRFRDVIHYEDSSRIELQIHTPDWQPLASSRKNIYVDPGRQLEVWPQFEKEDGVELRYHFAVVYGEERRVFEFNEEQLKNPQIIDTKISKGHQYITMTIFARGYGRLKLGNVEYRWTRYGMGTYLNGGHSLVDPKTREEVAYYFNPGDLKPPLCVYFAGYHSKKSFEGYFMMRRLNVPYLLITDSRLEGGQFYTGEFFSQAIPNVIDQYLQKLGFTRQQLILSGISMGTYGALKFGALMGVHEVIVAKPLVHLDSIATRGRLTRPDEFETAFDIERAIATQGQKVTDDMLLRLMDQQNLGQTNFSIAYMENDDYDATAFADLSRHLLPRANRLNSYSLPGRHNDDSAGMLQWFLMRYRQVLQHDFGR